MSILYCAIDFEQLQLAGLTTQTLSLNTKNAVKLLSLVSTGKDIRCLKPYQNLKAVYADSIMNRTKRNRDLKKKKIFSSSLELKKS